MNKTFDFFSDVVNGTLTIEIFINATEDESWVSSLEIFDDNGNVMSEQDLGPDEMRAINTLADEMAQENGYEAYRGAMESRGDFLYDQMKDNGYDEAQENGYEAYRGAMESKGDFLYDQMKDNGYDEAQDIINNSDAYMVSDENQ